MKLIDLSRELYHRTPAHPSHPPIAVATWYDHAFPLRIRGGTASPFVLWRCWIPDT